MSEYIIGFDDSYADTEEDTTSSSAVIANEEQETEDTSSYILGEVDIDSIEREPLSIVVTKSPEEEAPQDRVSQLLDDPEKIARLEQAQQERKDAIGYDEFSSEMETMLGEPEEEALPVTVQELAQSPRFMELASKYMSSRVGKEAGNIDNYESKEDFIERYMEHTRAVSTNMVSVARELSAIKKMSPEEKRDLAKLYRLTPAIASAGSKGGPSLLNAVQDYAYYSMMDPSNLITLGSGALVKAYATKKISNAGLQQVLKSDTAAMLGTAGVEGTLGWMEAADRQSTELELGLREERSFSEIALQAGLQSAFGAAGVKAGTFIGATGTSSKDRLDAKLAAGRNKEAAKEIRKAHEERIRIIDEFDPVLGRRILNQLQGGEAVAEGVVEPQVTRKVADDIYFVILDWADKNEFVRKELMEAMTDEDKRISDVVFTLVNSDKLDEAGDGILDTLRDSLARANVTQEEFGQAMRTSLSDAAKLMRDARTFKERMQKLSAEDPDAAGLILRISGADESVVGTGVWDKVMRADRETRALMVAGLGTTVRNVMSGVAVMGMQTANNLIDSTLYHGSLAMRDIKNSVTGKKLDAGQPKFSATEMFKDSFDLLYRLSRQSENMEMADRMLKGHDGLHERLFHDVGGIASNNVAGKELSAFARAANSLNRVQDNFFRRAMFTRQVDYYLKKSGQGSAMDYLRAKKAIPKKILEKAAEDSLKATFAYMPKQNKNAMEGFAYNIIKANEKLPFVPVIGTGDLPFVRFMTNAIAYQYKYSPLQLIGAGKDTAGVLNKMRKGETVDEADLMNVRNKFSSAIVGSGAFMAAYAYREENQDVDWFEMKDDMERPNDVRAVFPLAPYLLAADIVYKLSNGMASKVDVATALEGLTGAQFKTGTLYGMENLKDFLTDVKFDEAGNAIEDWSSESWTTFAASMGAYAGQQVGRVLTPAQIFSDVISSINEEEAVIRNRNFIESRVPEDAFFEGFENTLKYKAPGFSQDLPALKSPTREEEISRQDTSIRQIMGARVTDKRNPIEQELFNNGIKPYMVVPRTKTGVAQDVMKEMAPAQLELLMGLAMQTDKYKNGDAEEKRLIATNVVKTVRSRVKEQAAAVSYMRTKDGDQPYDYVARDIWLSLPRSTRKQAEKFMANRDIPPPHLADPEKYPAPYVKAVQIARQIVGQYDLFK